MVWCSHLLKNFLLFFATHTVEGFSVLNEAEVDVSLEFSCFFYAPTDVGNVISGSSAFSKSSLIILIKDIISIILKKELFNLKIFQISYKRSK